MCVCVSAHPAPWLENSVSLFLAWLRTLSPDSPLRQCHFQGAISDHPPFLGVIVSLFNLLTMLDARLLIVFHAVGYSDMSTFCLSLRPLISYVQRPSHSSTVSGTQEEKEQNFYSVLTGYEHRP